MPRLRLKFLRVAKSVDRLLPLLLREVRELPSAYSELRWLREHVAKSKPIGTREHDKSLRRLCLERSKGKPLQYVLGSQPFEKLEILCRSGVIIPRPETANYVSLLSSILINKARAKRDADQSRRPELRILDLCTGTGCIPLLLHSTLSPHYPNLALLGIDISSKALRLAKKNLEWNTSQGHLSPSARHQIRFQHADVLDPDQNMKEEYHIVISNPPYISPAGWATETDRCVRNFEPKLGLVPPQPMRSDDTTTASASDDGEAFYPRILQIAKACRAKMVLMEVDGAKQAGRVMGMATKSQGWDQVQVWRDHLDEIQWGSFLGGGPWPTNSNKTVLIMGQGSERVVFAAQQSFLEW